MKKQRPFLKWAGNKYSCMDHLIAVFPQASRLIEPFAGSAAVFLNTRYPAYLLAEDNLDIVSLYRQVQQEGQSFISYCQSFFVQETNQADCYYQLREKFNHLQDPRERAAIFLYLNRHGYNGLCRYNSKGLYNVPFGSYAKPYFPAAEMAFFYEKCEWATFAHHDFRQTFLLASPGDLIYCDPPYVPLKQHTNFSAYTGKKFLEVDQTDLVACTLDAVSRGITVAISNHDTAFTRSHYRDAEILSFPVRRLINCDIKNRLPVQELLAIFKP